MLGTNIVVQSYVIINEGCPMAIAKEGTDHVQIRCGGAPNDTFEIILQHGALRALVELGVDALHELEAVRPARHALATGVQTGH